MNIVGKIFRNSAAFIRWMVLDCWCKNPAVYPIGKILLVATLCLVLTVVSWISLNFFTYHRLYTDAGVFASVANHVLAGKVLYTEVWDHKPPMIYICNMVPLLAGDGSVLSIRFFERFYAIAGILSLFFSFLIVYKNPLLAFVACLIWNLHFYNPGIFQGGNLTEEYAAIFLLAGLFLLILSRYYPGTISRYLLIASGLFFSLAVFTKETFLFSSIPWFVFLLMGDWKIEMSRYQRGLFFLAGALIPAVFFGIMAIVQGNFLAWVDVLSYNVQYARHSRQDFSLLYAAGTHMHVLMKYVANQTHAVPIFFLLGLAGACCPSFVKLNSGFSLAGLAAFVFDFMGTRIGGYEIGHYYLQIVPAYVFVAGSGVAFLLFLLPSSIQWKTGVCVLMLVGFVVVDFRAVGLYSYRLTVPEGHPPVGAISRAIIRHRHDGDTLWAGRGENAKHYQETGLLSPVKYLYVYDHSFLDTWGSSAQEKRERLTEGIIHNPPTYMILSEEDFSHFRTLGLIVMIDWIEENYHPVPGVEEGKNRLFRWNRIAE